ncbi:MAG: hypothetical protein LBJ10_05510 [Clostridiales bacterium]|jgi:type IV secretory pathway TrbD component|nr:hypothetical protein [Clostridiales bacterium]
MTSANQRNTKKAARQGGFWHSAAGAAGARRQLLRALGAAAAAVIFCSALSYASEPGSSGDPIALKSYVDSRASAIEAKLDELVKRVDGLAAENEALRASIQQGGGRIPVVAGAQAGGDGAEAGAEADLAGGVFYASDPPYQFGVYEIKSGERVIMGAGAEMVIRTGKAAAIKGELGGVVDLIEGIDLEAGSNVQANHLLVSSRDDGRGVRFSADSFVLIKGSFELR